MNRDLIHVLRELALAALADPAGALGAQRAELERLVAGIESARAALAQPQIDGSLANVQHLLTEVVRQRHRRDLILVEIGQQALRARSGDQALLNEADRIARALSGTATPRTGHISQDAPPKIPVAFLGVAAVMFVIGAVGIAMSFDSSGLKQSFRKIENLALPGQSGQVEDSRLPEIVVRAEPRSEFGPGNAPQVNAPQVNAPRVNAPRVNPNPAIKNAARPQPTALKPFENSTPSVGDTSPPPDDARPSAPPVNPAPARARPPVAEPSTTIPVTEEDLRANFLALFRGTAPEAQIKQTANVGMRSSGNPQALELINPNLVGRIDFGFAELTADFALACDFMIPEREMVVGLLLEGRTNERLTLDFYGDGTFRAQGKYPGDAKAAFKLGEPTRLKLYRRAGKYFVDVNDRKMGEVPVKLGASRYKTLRLGFGPLKVGKQKSSAQIQAIQIMIMD